MISLFMLCIFLTERLLGHLIYSQISVIILLFMLYHFNFPILCIVVEKMLKMLAYLLMSD